MTEEEIRKYLAILKDRSYEMRIRKTKDNLKNQITQAMLKKSDDDMYELVRELEVCDFDFNKPDNPQPDNRLNQTGEMWFFRKTKWNEPFYIKTKVVERLKKSLYSAVILIILNLVLTINFTLTMFCFYTIDIRDEIEYYQKLNIVSLGCIV